jgi:HSP20 family protein
MELVRWTPWRDMFTLRNRINNLFEDAFPPARTQDDASFWNWSPVVDIFEEKDQIVIKAELPGVEKKDISLDVKGRVLTLRGERSSDREVSEENYYRRERLFGRFERAFTLPMEVSVDQVSADFKDGILKIEIPKPEEYKPKQIAIN